MSATKEWLMSPGNVADAEYGVHRAQRVYEAVCAACALAAHRVDAATLDDLTFRAARNLGEAHERLAAAQGYDGANEMAYAKP